MDNMKILVKKRREMGDSIPLEGGKINKYLKV